MYLDVSTLTVSLVLPPPLLLVPPAAALGIYCTMETVWLVVLKALILQAILVWLVLFNVRVVPLGLVVICVLTLQRVYIKVLV